MDQLQIIVRQIIGAFGYPGIFLIMLVENLFPPIPSEIVMPFAGFPAAEGRFSLFGILAAGTIGAGLGAVLIYIFSAWIGQERLRAWVRRYGKYPLAASSGLASFLPSSSPQLTFLLVFCNLLFLWTFFLM